MLKKGFFLIQGFFICVFSILTGVARSRTSVRQTLVKSIQSKDLRGGQPRFSVLQLALDLRDGLLAALHLRGLVRMLGEYFFGFAQVGAVRAGSFGALGVDSLYARLL
jgi:hypothetical protein